MIYSASSYKAQLDYGNPGYFMLRQAGIAGVSFVAMYIVSKIDYHWFARFAMLGYIVSYVTLLLTRFTPLGVASHGKKRWLRLGPLQFQPTEIVKISLILLLAVLIANLGVRINQLRAVGFIVALSAPLALLVTANNLSSGIIICGIVFVMLFVACKIKWPFFLCIGGGVGLLAVAPYIGHLLVKLHILKDYQLGRINVWVNPVQYARSGGYQVLQGLYAIGSGGLFGKGLGESLQKLGFVPESQNSETVSKSNFAVTVKKDGVLYLEDNKIEMKQLVANAAAESKRDAAFSVIIRADGEANYKTVIKLMDELKGAGVTRFGLATDLGDGK